jgi:hypothetical protein
MYTTVLSAGGPDEGIREYPVDPGISGEDMHERFQEAGISGR